MADITKTNSYLELKEKLEIDLFDEIPRVEIDDFLQQLRTRIGERTKEKYKEQLKDLVRLFEDKGETLNMRTIKHEMTWTYRHIHTPQQWRKIIQLLRENMSEFAPRKYLIAGQKGYKLTDNKEEIKRYLYTLELRQRSLNRQLLEGAKVRKNIEEKDNEI